ncbi:hypothetical protein SAMN04488057_11577 [Cyclobacterium lianum]|uniref:Uncharacterized protein n=1 Tax=Cyclobacterium lianum TaxID=388280 RepID=A0A1M7Q9A4_9BACT|nr:hypothetical protein [Cyclobacterium lianum]SHN27126.1 hypothetical protein SAMN04488057_11577 [Cyclobacterium lianum]
MKWQEMNVDSLLQKSFLFGMAGIISCMVPLTANALQWSAYGYLSLFTGLGLALQLFGLSLSVLVLRRRKIGEIQKEKAKKMVLVLAVALLFFILV